MERAFDEALDAARSEGRAAWAALPSSRVAMPPLPFSPVKFSGLMERVSAFFSSKSCRIETSSDPSGISKSMPSLASRTSSGTPLRNCCNIPSFTGSA